MIVADARVVLARCEALLGFRFLPGTTHIELASAAPAALDAPHNL